MRVRSKHVCTRDAVSKIRCFTKTLPLTLFASYSFDKQKSITAGAVVTHPTTNTPIYIWFGTRTDMFITDNTRTIAFSSFDTTLDAAPRSFLV